MQMVASSGVRVAKKNASGGEPAKRYGTLIRVSDQLADVIRKVCPIDGQSAAEFLDEHVLSIVQEIYRDRLAGETKRMAGGKPKGPKA